MCIECGDFELTNFILHYLVDSWISPFNSKKVNVVIIYKIEIGLNGITGTAEDFLCCHVLLIDRLLFKYLCWEEENEGVINNLSTAAEVTLFEKSVCSMRIKCYYNLYEIRI